MNIKKMICNIFISYDINMEEKKDCFHYSHHMFFRCPKHNLDNHYHCISCGTILSDNEDTQDMITAGIVFNYRFACEKLTDNKK